MAASGLFFSCADDDQTCTCDAVYRIGQPDPNVPLLYYDGLSADCETRDPFENPTGNENATFLYCQEEYE